MVMKNSFNPKCITFSQMNLIFNARIYYRRLTTWTRAYIISRYFGIGTAEELFGRLYLESLDIGNMLQIVFGREHADQYSQLVSQFPVAFRDLITAQIEGNTAAINQNVERLYQNVHARAEYLAAINPYWNAEEYNKLFATYIQYTIDEVNAIITGDYSKDIELFDQLKALTNRMGDTFAQGLYDYITSGQQSANVPAPTGEIQCITYDQMNTIFDIRMFWFELITWVRSFMLSRYKGIGNVPEVFARLEQVPVEYTNALKQIFGEQVAADLLIELNAFIDLLDAFITAQLDGNIDAINRITQLLYQNANARATLISSVNPFWEQSEWRNRLYNNLRGTIDQSTALLTEDYARSIDIFSRLLDLSESTSSYFAQGLFKYIQSTGLKS